MIVTLYTGKDAESRIAGFHKKNPNLTVPKGFRTIGFAEGKGIWGTGYLLLRSNNGAILAWNRKWEYLDQFSEIVVSVRQYAQRHNLTINEVRRQIHAGKLYAAKPGTQWIVYDGFFKS